MVILAALCACSEPPPTLRLATNIWPGYESLYLARDNGLLDGQQIHLVEMPSATDVFRTMRDGQLDAAALTLDEALRLQSAGVPLHVVMIFDVSAGGDGLLVRPNAGITTLADLKGKRVGVENSATGAILLNGALQAAGLGVSDIEQVFMSVEQTPDALVQGEVDAVVTFDPYLSRARQAGGLVLFDSRQLNGLIADVLVVRSDRLAALSTPLRQLISAHFKMLDQLHRHPELILPRMQPRMGLPAPEIARALEGLRMIDLTENRHLLGGESPGLAATLQTLAPILQGMGAIRTTKDAGTPQLTADLLPGE